MKWEMALEKGKCLKSQTKDWDFNSVERPWGTNDSSFLIRGVILSELDLQCERCETQGRGVS